MRTPILNLFNEAKYAGMTSGKPKRKKKFDAHAALTSYGWKKVGNKYTNHQHIGHSITVDDKKGTFLHKEIHLPRPHSDLLGHLSGMFGWK
jgi:hypothetical protein